MIHTAINLALIGLLLLLTAIVWHGGLGGKFNAFYLLLIAALLAAGAYHIFKQPVLWLLIGLMAVSVLGIGAGWLYFVKNTPSIIHNNPSPEQDKEKALQ